MPWHRAFLLILVLLLHPVASAQEAAGHSLVVIGAWDRALAVFERAAGDTGFRCEFVPAAEAGKLTAEKLAGCDGVMALNLEPQFNRSLVAALSAARERKPELAVFSLDPRDSQKDLEHAGLLVKDETIHRYWRFSGVENLRRMLNYLRVQYFHQAGETLPPVVVPDFGIYHPAAEGLFQDVPDYRKWYDRRTPPKEGAPRVALLVQQSFIVTEDTKVFAAIIEAFEKKGAEIGVFFAAEESKFQELLAAWKPELLIDDAHASPAAMKFATAHDVPHLKDISMLRSTVADWEASPEGLSFEDVSLHLLTQELYGIIDPVVVGGLKTNVAGYRIHEPIPERIERLTGRSLAWIHLRRLKNADKKIAIFYYNKYLGQGDLARGSPSGAFLDGPESLVRFLHALRDAGYRVDRVPADAEELIGWMKKGGRNIGRWAPGDLATLVGSGDPVKIPAATYQNWFATLGDANRAALNKSFGPPPGEQMVWRENERDYLVLPRIDLGNVILLPQPARGAENDEKLLHDRSIPPPHQYLACYWWLQHDWKADAVVHFGTHGSELLLPLKSSGLSKDDFGDICLGNMPNITPWIIDNASEATLAKRRASAVLVDHLTPPLVGAGLSADLINLHEDIHKFQSLGDGLMKETYRKSIAKDSRVQNLGPKDKAEAWSDADIEAVSLQIHEINAQIAPMKLHVLGQAPAGKDLVEFVTSMLGWKFIDALAAGREGTKNWTRDEKTETYRPIAEKVVESWITGNDTAIVREGAGPFKELALDYRNRLLGTDAEITRTLKALDGGFVPPGPCNDPVRNPGAVPTGRNMYAVNPEEIPTRQAWEVGIGLIDQLLEKRVPNKVAFDLNSFETMRDYGVMEAQILYLMGVRPVWDSSNLASDVQLIPREELGRPRIDVFIAISGTTRDNFPSRIRLIDKAVRLVSELDEEGNQVREHTLARMSELRERNFSVETAAKYGAARIFGEAPGEYGTRILYLIPKSGAWDKEAEVADVYLDNMSYVYTGDVWGEKVEGLYEQAMQGSDLVLRTWASNMMSPLSNHHVYEYAGGLSMAIRQVTGKQPDLLLNDVRDAPRLREFEEALTTEFHATLLNDKWIRGMKENDYAGAGMMAELVKNTFGWRVTRPDSIDNTIWDRIHDTYVKDKRELGLREWMDRINPHAFQEIAATLLEANRKGYWSTDRETLENLAKEFAESVAKHGASGGLVSGGNMKLREMIEKYLSAPGLEAMLQSYQEAVDRSEKPSPDTNRVAGTKLDAAAPATASATPAPVVWFGWIVGTAVAVLAVIGFLRRSGAPA